MSKNEFKDYFSKYQRKKEKLIDIEEIKATVNENNPITIKGDLVFFLPKYYPEYGIRYMSWKRYQELKTFLSFELRNQTNKEQLIEHNLLMYSKSIDDFNPEPRHKMKVEVISGVPIYIFEGEMEDEEAIERIHPTTIEDLDILRKEERTYEGLPDQLKTWLKNFVKKLRGE